jgi:hypothetical protein
MDTQKIINCKICGLSNIETNFQPKKRKCVKCNSKISNSKLGNEYFRNYMKSHYISRKKTLENSEN